MNTGSDAARGSVIAPSYFIWIVSTNENSRSSLMGASNWMQAGSSCSAVIGEAEGF